MNDTILIGKKYKIFLGNGFKYEGVLLVKDNFFLKIRDHKLNKEILMPIRAISFIEEVV